MFVRLLGTAAGGGFPQWNCNCENCAGIRAGTLRATPRTQSCIALSADGSRWFLLNASPDIRVQIEAFAPLLPPPGSARGSGIEGILLTNADLDHTLGLFIVREGRRLSVHATPTVRRALCEGLALDAVLDCYCGLDWHEPPTEWTPLLCANGISSGLRYAAFLLPGKPPRYREKQVAPAPDDSIGYAFQDERTGGTLAFLPDVAILEEETLARLRAFDVILFDGTFWSDDEMQHKGVGEMTAARMGHLPVGGPEGSLARIAPLTQTRRIYVHINNTNPILLEDSPERAQVEAAGVEIGWDGLELTI